MLNEDDVVEAVAKHLETHGYRIHSRATTQQHGHDIVAKRDSTRVTIYVEAKGETSNRPGSARHGKPFNSAQCRVHVGVALYSAAAVLTTCEDSAEARSTIALPDTPCHRECVKRIEAALDLLKVGVFWVSPSREVQFEGPWTL
jgi:Holliday junction resolvase-like predicted endonuclease